MTCIAAVVHNGKVYMGGDAAGSNDYFVETRVDSKVFQVDEFLIGYTSSFRMGQLLKYCFKPPKIGRNKDVMAYMVKKFVPALHKLFENGEWSGDPNPDNEAEERRGGVFLVGVRGRLFRLESNFQVADAADEYAACGSGASYALGALGTLSHNNSPNDRLTKALTVAAHHDPFVRGPFTIITHKSR